MALRIHTAITHGEIDNTKQGRVRARLWVLGRTDPVELDLNGDAWRDVAGARVTFINPAALEQPEALKLQSTQTGVAGDITASRKVKVFTGPEEEWRAAYREDRMDEVPTEWRNSLYLEWFTAEQGRCLVESADFEITISDRVWEMDEDEEGAQKLANMQAMRDFLAAIIQRPERPEAQEEDEEIDDEEEEEITLSEEAWEEQLKASDRLTDASLEAYEKYGEDEDADEKTAFVMGWDHLLEDMADAQEGVMPSDNDSAEKKRRREWADLMNEVTEEAEAAEDSWLEDQEAVDPHPLKDQAHDYLLQVMGELSDTDMNEDRGEDPNHPLDSFVSNIMQISGKLAGALHSQRELETATQQGYALAITKRCLIWANEALAALNALADTAEYAEHRPLFENWQEGLFNLRASILRLRDELRAE